MFKPSRRVRYPHLGIPLGSVNKMADHLIPIGLSPFGHRAMSANYSLRDNPEHDPVRNHLLDIFLNISLSYFCSLTHNLLFNLLSTFLNQFLFHILLTLYLHHSIYHL